MVSEPVPELRIPPAAFAHLARHCMSDGEVGLAALHQAGRLTGEAVFERLNGGRSPESLEPAAFWAAAGTRIERMGLGRIRFAGVRSGMAEIIGEGLPDPEPGAGHPFTAGLIAGLLGRAAGESLDVVEVGPCRSAGDRSAPAEPTSWRFLAGDEDRLRDVRRAPDSGTALQGALERNSAG